MPPPDDEIIFHFEDSLSSDEKEELHETVTENRSRLSSGVLIVAAGAIGLALVLSGRGGNIDDSTAAPSTAPSTTAPTTTAPTTAAPATTVEPPSGPFASPSVEGALANGTPFVVTEPDPGVLCAVIDEVETCHLELVTASGAGVVDDRLVFGYLRPGTASASIRYRTGQPSSSGIRIEPDARFFALPLRASDPYRLQYRDGDFEVEDEVALVARRGGPSQTPADAARDGIPADIAGLDFDRRVDVAAEWTAFIEGPLVWSQQPSAFPDHPGWGELLRLDDTGTEILHAVALPGIRLNSVLARPGVMYFLGQQIATPDQIAVDRGEVTFPIVLIRIDRTNEDHRVVLYPQTSADGAVEPITQDPNWTIGPELPLIDPERLGGSDAELRLETPDGTITIDATTLLPN